MTTEPWWKTSTVYQIYPRSFADSDGDGIGDLGGIISHLAHLGALGVDVLWLSPVYPSPQDDNGYDISDYQDIEPTFGTLAQFDVLVREAHALGIRIVMDLVVNHTSDEHAWFAGSRSARESETRDWYIWRPPRAGFTGGEPGAEPNNWGSFFSGPAWEFDDASGEYYLHLFSRKQPDLNWENPEVRAAVFAMMRWWLDRGVDGFRMDVVNMIAKHPDLPDGPASASAYADPLPFLAWEPRIHTFLQQMHREVFEGRDVPVLTVGEMPGVTVAAARLFTAADRRELDMVFQFEHVSLDQGNGKWDIQPLRLTDLKASLGRWQEGMADAGWNSLYWSNHDQPRAVSRFGDDGEHRVRSAKTLATMLHLHRGTPYVYQGEELGMTNASFPTVADFRDIESLNHFAAATGRGEDTEHVLAALRTMGRDNARTPMQWTAGPQAGFTTGSPWIEVNPNHTRINAEESRRDPDSVFHHYRRLIELRKTEPVVAHGGFALLLPDHPQVYAFTRTLGETTLLVIANLSGEAVDVPLEGREEWERDWSEADLVIGDDASRPGLDLHLDAWQSRVYRLALPRR